MKQFLKDNIAIVAAIALPVILVLVFAISTSVVNGTVPDPKYDFLYATNYNGGNEAYYYDVVQDRLKISYVFPVKATNGTYQYNNVSHLWRVHVPAMTVEEISLMPPTQGQNTEGKRIPVDIPGVSELHVSAAQTSPDDYTFQQSYNSYDTNLMMELFSGSENRYRNTSAIVRDHRAVPVKSMNGEYNSYNTRFVGWILKD